MGRNLFWSIIQNISEVAFLFAIVLLTQVWNQVDISSIFLLLDSMNEFKYVLSFIFHIRLVKFELKKFPPPEDLMNFITTTYV